MRNIMQYEQYKELYTIFLILKSVQKQRDYTYKGGGMSVTITTNKRDYGKFAKRN